jgi:anti-anti-sigma factor
MTMSANPPPRYAHLQISRQADILVLTFTDTELSGDDVVHGLRAELLAAVAEAGAAKVVLDLRNVQYLGSSIFRPFLSLKHRLEEKGGRMVLCGLGPTLMEVFRVTRLIAAGPALPGVFDSKPDVPAAVDLLQDD